MSSDLQHMQHALRLAAQSLGRTAPNPSVGCVIVNDGVIVGRGMTARGGRPHAETIALEQAAHEANGATMYVTLEPCNHQGVTPPCTQAIIRAGIKRVVIGARDLHEKAGGGAQVLRDEGIEVVMGVAEEEAKKINQGFFNVLERKRPYVTLKTATSRDGKITNPTSDSPWITEEEARRFGHYLRAQHDAILTGIGTALADDPQLTCRLPGREEDSPQRVVLDSKLRLPPSAKILPAWIITSYASLKDKTKLDALIAKGARIFAVEEVNGKLSLPATLQLLASLGITRLMVEGGSEITTAFLQARLVDRLCWFHAPMEVGARGKDAVMPSSDANAPNLSEYKEIDVRILGKDVLEIFDSEPRV